MKYYYTKIGSVRGMTKIHILDTIRNRDIYAVLVHKTNQKIQIKNGSYHQ